MNKSSKKALNDSINSSFKSIQSLQYGSKERATEVEVLTKLYRLGIEEEKAEQDFKIRKEESKNASLHQIEEYELKNRQFELDKDVKSRTAELSENDIRLQKLDKYVRWGISVVEIILPLVFYAYWMRKGLEFERTGTFTSTTFRGLFSHFKPIKK